MVFQCQNSNAFVVAAPSRNETKVRLDQQSHQATSQLGLNYFGGKQVEMPSQVDDPMIRHRFGHPVTDMPDIKTSPTTAFTPSCPDLSSHQFIHLHSSDCTLPHSRMDSFRHAQTLHQPQRNLPSQLPKSDEILEQANYDLDTFLGRYREAERASDEKSMAPFPTIVPSDSKPSFLFTPQSSNPQPDDTARYLNSLPQTTRLYHPSELNTSSSSTVQSGLEAVSARPLGKRKRFEAGVSHVCPKQQTFAPITITNPSLAPLSSDFPQIPSGTSNYPLQYSADRLFDTSHSSHTLPQDLLLQQRTSLHSSTYHDQPSHYTSHTLEQPQNPLSEGPSTYSVQPFTPQPWHALHQPQDPIFHQRSTPSSLQSSTDQPSHTSYTSYTLQPHQNPTSQKGQYCCEQSSHTPYSGDVLQQPTTFQKNSPTDSLQYFADQALEQAQQTSFSQAPIVSSVPYQARPHQVSTCLSNTSLSSQLQGTKYQSLTATTPLPAEEVLKGLILDLIDRNLKAIESLSSKVVGDLLFLEGQISVLTHSEESQLVIKVYPIFREKMKEAWRDSHEIEHKLKAVKHLISALTTINIY